MAAWEGTHELWGTLMRKEETLAEICYVTTTHEEVVERRERVRGHPRSSGGKRRQGYELEQRGSGKGNVDGCGWKPGTEGKWGVNKVFRACCPGGPHSLYYRNQY